MTRTGGYLVPFATRGSLLDAGELAAVDEVLRSSDALSGGPWRERFERHFAEHVGSRFALSTTSGTVALQLAIRMLDLRAGDEVVVTPQTFQATAQPLLDEPASVRFCDVDPHTLNMDPTALRALLTPRTEAIVLVHYGGLPAAMSEIVGMARRRGVAVVEDCAHALGSRYRGARPGGIADIGCFSFHSSKNITTLGEGGMLTLDDPGWAERIDRVRSNEVDGCFVTAPAGGVRAGEPKALPWMRYAQHAYRQDCLRVRGAGTNATMSETAAAVGLVQMAKLDQLVARRRAIAEHLDEVLSRFDGVRPHAEPPDAQHARHLYTFFLAGGKQRRYQLIQALDSRGVEIQLRYFPLHLLPEWRHRGHRLGECPVAERVWFNEHMNLPCHPGLSDAQVELLGDALADSLAEVCTSVTARVVREGTQPCP